MKHRSALLPRAAVVAAFAGTIGLFTAWTSDTVAPAAAFHTKEELLRFKAGPTPLPTGNNGWFTGSGICSGCHGHDPLQISMVDTSGRDVNVTDDWRSSMMANSARDPFWRAKVSHEVLVNPAHQAVLEDKCTSCHAPQGRHQFHLDSLGLYSIAHLDTDQVALDGVSCVGCHRQSADSVGLLFSGNIKFEQQDILYGPYSDNIFTAPMVNFVGYEPMFGAHIHDAGLCAGCHTLITETVDTAGNYSGDQFVEQATYHEWVNSAFNNEVDTLNGITCQGCHLPRIPDGVIISSNYAFLDPRSPYGMHHFAGGNMFMLRMLREHIAELGLTATETQFDSTIARTVRNLQQHSVLLDAGMVWRDLDTAFIDVELTNLTGHKFPSGFPSRRAFVELVVKDAVGDTLFKSGRWGSGYEVEGHDTSYERHYDMINAQDQAQIYEMVMGDVNDDKTTVLQRAKAPLKDNRLAPLGFTTAHYAYDTMPIAGVPVGDTDFNHDDLGTEGSGTDVVHYHVPTGGYAGLLQVSARVWYQSVPPLWNQEMFAHASAEIDSFKTMYEASDGSPVLCASDFFSDLSVGIDGFEELGVVLFPNPVTNGELQVLGLDRRVQEIQVFDVNGRLVARTDVDAGRHGWRVRLPDGAGTYLVVFRTAEKVFVERVVAF